MEMCVNKDNYTQGWQQKLARMNTAFLIGCSTLGWTGSLIKCEINQVTFKNFYESHAVAHGDY